MNPSLARRLALAETLARPPGSGSGSRVTTAAELLAAPARGITVAWWEQSKALVAPQLGASQTAVSEDLAALARRVQAEAGGLVTPLDAMRAFLANLEAWHKLGIAGRCAAVDDERWARLGRELAAVIDAVNTHGLPVSAPELRGEAIWWGWGWTDRLLRALVADGQLRDTGERSSGWPVYAAERG